MPDGILEKIPSSKLGSGDLVICCAGDFIPSDGEIIEGAATVDESARITVLNPEAVTAVRGVSVVSVTPVQVVGPLVTLNVNGLLVLNAPPCPTTRT